MEVGQQKTDVELRSMMQPVKFEVMTPLGFTVRTTESYWQKLLGKHPDLAELLESVMQALAEPVQIRRSSRDPAVFLFYRVKGEQRWVVAVVRRLNGDGFIITAYQTDAIKEGEIIWPI